MNKSKSMLQEECAMTPFLEKRGIKVIESDLGERIQQLDGQPPSHIVFPAIHKTRRDVAEVFARTIGTDPSDDDPHHLTELMRNNARPRFLAAGSAPAGGHIAISAKGTLNGCVQKRKSSNLADPSAPPILQSRHWER